jgi:3-oxoacyl-(acyl-carrier-protein) synthase
LNTRIHIVGAGIISAIGTSWEEVFASLKVGKSGIDYPQHMETIHRNTFPLGEVKLSNADLVSLLDCKMMSRTTLLAWYAVKQAIRSAGDFSRKGLRVGLISGTTVGGMDQTERAFPSFLESQQIEVARMQEHPCGAHTRWIADTLGDVAYVNTINTACSSSLNAIALGSRLLRSDALDVVIAGGTDALTAFTLNGFNSLMIVDQSLTKPFDANRKGLNLGEGAGYVVMVSEKLMESLSLSSLGVVAGYANTNDAFHQTASSPDGRGSREAMIQALSSAGLSIDDIDYINLHGTGTSNNDLSEGIAVQHVFGNQVPSCSSTKAYTGHTLGASGAIEIIISLMALQQQCVFPNLRWTTPIPELSFIPQLNFQQKEIRHVMSNAFGFGGNCSTLILSKS